MSAVWAVVVMIVVGIVAWARRLRSDAPPVVTPAARETEAVRKADEKRDAARKQGTLRYVNERFGRGK